MELPFTITFTFSRKYSFSKVHNLAKWHNVMPHCSEENRKLQSKQINYDNQKNYIFRIFTLFNDFEP